MKQLLKNAKNIIAILILAITLNGCENTNDDNLPEVIAGFTHTINEISGTVTFINTTTDATKYVWDFGDGTTSTEINPIKSYASGTYTITLRAFNVSGASDTYEDTITILRKGPATLPINFDEANVIYNVTSFNGASFSIVDNPALSGTNDKASKVGKITNIGAAYEGIYLNLGTQVDLSSNKTIKMNFWSNSAVDVLLKLEDGTAAAVEVTTNHKGTGWESISFNFNSSAKYTKFTLFVDGPGTKAGNFYFDDVMQIQTPPPPCAEEAAETLSAATLNMTFKTDLTANFINDGANFKWVFNPKSDTGINTSCKVGEITKLGANPWDNTQYNLSSKLDFNANAGLKIKVYSAKAGFKVRIKLEEIGNAGNNTELEVTSTKTNEWEELTFPFASTHSGKFNKIVLFFDLNANNKDVYYFDDLKVYAATVAACVTDPIETLTATGLNMTFKTDLTANFINDGANFKWVNNPKSDTGINTSCKVGEITKQGANPWDNTQYNLSSKLDFNANAGLKIKVYSAKAGFKVRIKLEEIGNAGNNTELEVTSTKTNEWEELTFPFASTHSGKFNKIVLFFDLNANNKDVYYFDDLKVYASGGGGGGTCPAPPAGDLIPNGNFEAGDGCWELINNGGLVTISSTESSGSGSKSGQIDTATFKNPGIKQTRFAVGNVLPNRSYRVTFDIKASASKPLVDGAVFQAFVFSEGVDGGSTAATQHILVQGLGSVSTSWESKSYTFTSGAAANNVAGGFSFLAELVCGGAGTCDGIINIDNVSIKLVP